MHPDREGHGSGSRRPVLPAWQLCSRSPFSSSISVYKSSPCAKKVRLQHFFTPDKATVMSLACTPSRLYAGLVDGAVAIYTKAQGEGSHGQGAATPVPDAVCHSAGSGSRWCGCHSCGVWPGRFLPADGPSPCVKWQ